ncbi:MAG TPA: hypothetical protein VJ792_07590 [Candidatus Nitrosotalea sp.]|nr:hypothetical protein [Candidatus Nitrosotalea sp.]
MKATPSQRWNEEIAKYKKKCQQILGLSTSIRYVGLINQYGRTLTGIIRPGTKILLRPDPARNEFFLVSTVFNMRNKIDSAIGSLEYAVFRHNKVTLLVFQSREGIYYVSMSKNVTTDSMAKIVAKIKKVI